MRIPLEYGDNFPVPAGSWDPRFPWRFPQVSQKRFSVGLLRELLPWIMLGVGITIGLAFSVRLSNAGDLPGVQGIPKGGSSPRVEIPTAAHPTQMTPPRTQPIKARSRLA